jgi:hypothetical protein
MLGFRPKAMNRETFRFFGSLGAIGRESIRDGV